MVLTTWRRNCLNKMSYFTHLIVNILVGLKCQLLAVMHILHGLIPIKYTSHDWLTKLFNEAIGLKNNNYKYKSRKIKKNK
jgi:hypothetical protein